MDGQEYRDRGLSCSESDSFSSDSESVTEDEIKEHAQVFRYGEGPSFQNRKAKNNILGEYKNVVYNNKCTIVFNPVLEKSEKVVSVRL